MLLDLLGIYMQRKSRNLKGFQTADHIVVFARGGLCPTLVIYQAIETIVLCFV